jgi:hypothetical protein
MFPVGIGVVFSRIGLVVVVAGRKIMAAVVIVVVYAPRRLARRAVDIGHGSSLLKIRSGSVYQRLAKG